MLIIFVLYNEMFGNLCNMFEKVCLFFETNILRPYIQKLNEKQCECGAILRGLNRRRLTYIKRMGSHKTCFIIIFPIIHASSYHKIHSRFFIVILYKSLLIIDSSVMIIITTHSVCT